MTRRLPQCSGKSPEQGVAIRVVRPYALGVPGGRSAVRLMVERPRRRLVVAVGCCILGATALLYPMPSTATRNDAPLAPPVLAEPYTTANCPSDRSERGTTRIEIQCSHKRVLQTDARVNALVKSIVVELGTTRSRREFISAERDWHRYRQSTCKSRSGIYRGGSVEPIVFADCQADLNIAHARELLSFSQGLRRR